MTFLVLAFAAYLAVTAARRAYPAAIGETFNHGGRPISARGALFLSAGIAAIVFSVIAMPWLIVVPLSA